MNAHAPLSADKQAIANLLLVDETTDNIEYLSHQLHDHFDINFAGSGQMAIKLLHELNIDVVLINADSQYIDCQLLCSQCELPVILFTKELYQQVLVDGYLWGAVDVVSSNVTTKEWICRINAHIAIDKLRRIPASTLGHLRIEKAQMNQPTTTEHENDMAKVLLVDDSVNNIQVLNEILSKEYEIFFATNGQQAIEMAIELQPDLILLDVVMPKLNGYQVCQQLKSMQETKDIGIIFVTALNDDEDEAKGLELGAIDYIVKPFNPHIVRARMHNHMELVQHRKMLSSLSMTDGLTDIANRRHFDQVMHRELHRAIRQQESLTLMMIDIDNFKKYNDYYGHVNGDECLKEVAAVLDSCRVRMTDFVARYGGEEFAVILPNTTFDGAQMVANKTLKAIEALDIEHVNNNGYGVVTVSIGVYCAVPLFNSSKEQLLAQADDALYQAKEQGRNRVVFATVQ